MEENDKRSKLIVHSFLAICFLAFFGYYILYYRLKLNTSGKYTIATYHKTIGGGRSGYSDEYYFYYDGKKYFGDFKTIRSSIHKYYYCEFVPSNPDINNVLYEIDVPYCFTPDIVPAQGWQELPADTCSEDIKPIKTRQVYDE